MRLIQIPTLPVRLQLQPLPLPVIPKTALVRPQRQAVPPIRSNFALVPSRLSTLHGRALIDRNGILEPAVRRGQDHLEGHAAAVDLEVAELPARVEDGGQGAAVAARGGDGIGEGVRVQGGDGAEGAGQRD